MPLATSRAMAQVMANQFCKLQASTASVLPAGQLLAVTQRQKVVTPLKVEAWQSALAAHPDRAWVKSLLGGLQRGFRIGLLPQAAIRSSPKNLPSAQEHSEVISSYLQQQVQAGLGVIPKSTPGKFRVIVDLSSPKGHSVNDNLHRKLTHVTYSSVEDAALMMHTLGRGSQLAKIDIRNAYRIFPIHPSERNFLGVLWQGQVFIDCQLPFGLASAPAIFSAVAEALEWILRSRGVRGVLHYLDDFLLLGSPNTGECAKALALTVQVCQELGVPLAEDKMEGPTQSLTSLGSSCPLTC